jgi:phage anti-repressor protein/phage antirepressor YoqD-like protein
MSFDFSQIDLSLGTESAQKSEVRKEPAMNELIALNSTAINGETIPTVNARELHAFLEVKIRFNDWIKQRIEQYGFKEGVDYVRFELEAGMKMSENGGEIGGIANAQKNVALESMGYKSFGQQGRIEYALTLNMSKELAMVERNEKGKQARDYFLDCERRAKANVPALPGNYLEALKALTAEVEARQEVEKKAVALEHKVEKQAPKVAALERIAVPTEGSVCLRIAAKLLQMPEKRFLQFAQDEGYIFRNHCSRIWQGYSDKWKKGLVEQKITTIERDDGTLRTVEQVLITRAGLADLAERKERMERCKTNTKTTASTSTTLKTSLSLFQAM